jgi:hypothetical protein
MPWRGSAIHCLIESLQVYGVDDEITGFELHGIDGVLECMTISRFGWCKVIANCHL